MALRPAVRRREGLSERVRPVLKEKAERLEKEKSDSALRPEENPAPVKEDSSRRNGSKEEKDLKGPNLPRVFARQRVFSRRSREKDLKVFSRQQI